MTRDPTDAVNSAVARPAGLSQGSSKIVARSPGDGVRPDLANFYRCAIRRAVRVGV